MVPRQELLYTAQTLVSLSTGKQSREKCYKFQSSQLSYPTNEYHLKTTSNDEKMHNDHPSKPLWRQTAKRIDQIWSI
jgi:hypothetical protein